MKFLPLNLNLNLNLNLSLILTLSLLSCNTTSKNTTFSPANLESFFVTIPAGKDTILRTPKGAAISIRKGTFAADQPLEIREAYTIKDILLAGLVTESDGHPLRSGGMIYINTPAGENLPLQKPMTVLLPASGVEQGMQLFKGELEDGSVNWIPSDTVQPTISEALLADGKAIYVANCLTCHNINRPRTGPALSGVQARGPWPDFSNLVRWIRNPGAFIPTTAYTRELTRQYSGQVMPSFPQLAESDIAAVMAFIQNESAKAITDTFQLPVTAAAATGIETGNLMENNACNDTLYNTQPLLPALSNQEVTTWLSDTLPRTVTTPVELQPGQGLRRGFTDWQVSDGAYRFEINTLGWYNVDAFVEGLPGTTLCQLTVQLSGEGSGERLNVYAFFPQQKNISVGVQQRNGLFSFDKVEGRIPLYLGEKGTLIAFGNRGEQFYFGTAHITVKNEQAVTVALRPATKQELLRAVKEEKIEGINMDAVRQEIKKVPCASSSAINSQ